MCCNLTPCQIRKHQYRFFFFASHRFTVPAAATPENVEARLTHLTPPFIQLYSTHLSIFQTVCVKRRCTEDPHNFKLDH